MAVILGEEAEGYGGDWVVAPGAVQAAEEVLAFQSLQVLELVSQLEELSGGEQDGIEGVHHGGRKLEVLFPQQDICHRMEDVLCIQQEAELPDDEWASGLQELPFTAECLQKVDHELVKVGVHGGSGGRAF